MEKVNGGVAVCVPPASVTVDVYVIAGLSFFVMSMVLIWGLRLIGRALASSTTIPDGGEEEDVSVMKAAFMVPVQLSGTKSGDASPKVTLPDTSNIAVAIGAMSLAAFFVGLAYFSLHALFFNPCNLKGLSDLYVVIAGGAALFLPYAVKSLASIFS